MQAVDYLAVAEKAMQEIKKGAFLTVKAGNSLNTMAIGWATIGYCWRKPIFMIAVRDSRHTFGIIEKATDFTVSIPSGNMHAQVMYCGTKSGRDVDKFKECSLVPFDAQKVTSPILDIAGLHVECNIIYKSAMDPHFLDIGCDAAIYPEKDYHTLYFGDILACYER